MHRICTILTMLLALGSVPCAQSADGLSGNVDMTKKRATIHRGDETFMLSSDGKTILVNVGGYQRPVRFSLAEKVGRRTDWLNVEVESLEFTKDTDTEKVAVLTGKVAYRETEAPKNTGRAMAAEKGQPAPKLNAAVRATMSVKQGVPGVSFTYSLQNDSDPMPFYLLPWISGGKGYAMPGPTGPMHKEYVGKYATVSKKGLEWVLVNDTKADSGLGIVFGEPDKIFVGEHSSTEGGQGSIYLNYVPQYPELKKGESVMLSFTFLPTNDIAKVQAAASKR